MIEFRVNKFGECPDIERFHYNFVRFQKNCSHGALHIGIAADQQRKSCRLGMPHRRNHRKSISGMRHVQVGDEHVKLLGCDMR